MFARFDENPAMTLRVIKETKRYGRTDGRTDGQRENSIPPTNKVCGGYKNTVFFCLKIFFTFTNSVDPDEMPHYAAFHLGLHCLQKYSFRGYPNTKG